MNNRERSGKIIIYSLLAFMIFSGTAVTLYFHLRYQILPSYSESWVRDNIQVGMSKSQVRELMGDPEDDHGDGWIYHTRTSEDDGELATRIFVIFSDDRVKMVNYVTPKIHRVEREEDKIRRRWRKK